MYVNIDAPACSRSALAVPQASGNLHTHRKMLDAIICAKKAPWLVATRREAVVGHTCLKDDVDGHLEGGGRGAGVHNTLSERFVVTRQLRVSGRGEGCGAEGPGGGEPPLLHPFAGLPAEERSITYHSILPSHTCCVLHSTGS